MLMTSCEVGCQIRRHLGIFSRVAATVSKLRIVCLRFSTFAVRDDVIYGAVIKSVYFIVTKATCR